ncbi:MAG: Hsp20/alpha crystallin family protein [Candidatus Gastranaerophilales bacterium]|nr:Hsp20/alpha crystallin family protein [Candidatus Gastranaerophilales bacterium]
MEENVTNEEKKNIDNEQTKKSDRFIIQLLVAFFAIFIGAFLAFFLVFSNIIKNTHIAYNFDNQASSKFSDIIFKNADQEFNRMFKESQIFPKVIRFNNDVLKPENATLRTEETPKEYKVIINLKSFGNDEKNVSFKTDKNRITISAKYKNEKDKNSFSSTNFYESFGLPGKIDNSKIIKEKNGDNLVITIPKKS